MKTRLICGLGALALVVAAACSEVPDSGTLVGVYQASMARGGNGGGLPTCSGASACAAGTFVCAGEDTTSIIGSVVIADRPSGLSSDTRGAYIQGTNGVQSTVVSMVAALGLYATKSLKNPRTYTLNLNNPVPGGGGVPLGIISDGVDVYIETQWYTSNNARQNLHNIPVGQTVSADQIDVPVHINGRYHILQMGPQAYGHCHAAPTAVSGNGTSAGTITRLTATKWAVDLPAGSIGRLFDLYNTDQYAVDKGLYYTALHYEIGD